VGKDPPLKRSAIIGPLLLAAVPGLGLAQPLAQVPTEPIPARPTSAAGAPSGETYWTDQRMREAQPMPLPALPKGSCPAATDPPSKPPEADTSGGALQTR
jgi:hypothetical protein